MWNHWCTALSLKEEKKAIVIIFLIQIFKWYEYGDFSVWKDSQSEISSEMSLLGGSNVIC